jgi:hypothetical protein
MDVETIPPEVRKACLEAALEAVRKVLANWPTLPVDELGELQLIDLLGNIAFTRYLDREEEEAHQADDLPPARGELEN